MPKKDIDYSKTLIYKIVCKDLTITDLYVGNTTDFTVRKNKHKCDCNKKAFLIYKTINDNGGWDNWDMIEIEKYPCKDGNEARTRERYWYEELNAKLNSRRPIVSLEELKEEEKEYQKGYSKKYFQENKEQLIEYKKEWYETNKEKLLEKMTCECGCIICKNSLTSHLKTAKHLNKIVGIKD